MGVRAPCVGRVSFGLRLVPQQRSLAWPSLANAILGLVCLLRSPSRVGLYGCLGLACDCPVGASVSHLGLPGSPKSWCGFHRVPGSRRRGKSIANAAMAKKTKSKAPAKKPTAAKPKATSKSSSGGAVVEVEACKS